MILILFFLFSFPGEVDKNLGGFRKIPKNPKYPKLPKTPQNYPNQPRIIGIFRWIPEELRAALGESRTKNGKNPGEKIGILVKIWDFLLKFGIFLGGFPWDNLIF